MSYSRYLVEKAEQMKMAAITTAEGDAQAAKLLAKVKRFLTFILSFWWARLLAGLHTSSELLGTQIDLRVDEKEKS